MLQYSPLFLKIYAYVVAFVIGSVMGSAMNCLCYRLVHHEKWSGANRSRCPSCGHELGVLDLIPIFSYLFLGGKCRYCKKHISARYMITELIMGCAFTLILLKFDISFFALGAAVLSVCLFCLSLVDFDTFEIPDRFILIPAVFRIIYVFFFGYNYNQSSSDGLIYGTFKSAVHSVGYTLCIGLGLGVAILIICLIMDKVLGKESMGGGDIKLLGMLGLWFDLWSVLLMLLIACIIGIVFAFIQRKREEPVNPEDGSESPTEESEESSENFQGRFPFGPAIALASFITMMLGDILIGFYLNLF